MSERVIFDPVELLPARTQLDITDWIDQAGVDWGEAVQVPYRAEGERGQQVIDSKLENRTITGGLVLQPKGGTAFATIRSLLQGKLAMYQREGGIIKRITPQGGTVYADIVASGLHLSGAWMQANKEKDVESGFTLEAIPDFYEPEAEVASAEEKTLPELTKVIPDPGGDMPARVRIVVEEKQGVDQRGLIWGFRSRYYSSATTAKPAYSATELQPLGEAVKEAVTGATGGTAVSNTALPAVWTPVVGTNLGGTAWLTHQGTYRVFARLRSPQGAAVSARFVWDVGDLVYPTENSAWTVPAASAWFVADMGEIRLQAPPVGTYRWQGQIQAKGTEGGEDINVDRIWLVNEDEGMGVLSAPPQSSSSQETVKAWDNFNATAAGTITGKVAPLGGTWTGAGDAVGFTVDTTNKWLTRSEGKDADIYTGYYARLGMATATTIDVSCDFEPSEGVGTSRQGIFARYVDISNWLMVTAEYGSLAMYVDLRKRIGGVVTELGEAFIPYGAGWVTVRMTIDTSGNVSIYQGAQGGALTRRISLNDPALATGGSLASGGYGIYDAYTPTAGRLRKFDNFYVHAPVSSTPVSDAVVYASRNAQLTTRGMYRLDSGGTAYGPISRVIGDLPRLPAGGNEGRAVELFMKGSRGELDQAADTSIDDVAVKVFASRSWLTVPGT